jgi:hypothetical protein
MNFELLCSMFPFFIAPVAYLYDTSDGKNQCIGLHQPGDFDWLMYHFAGWGHKSQKSGQTRPQPKHFTVKQYYRDHSMFPLLYPSANSWKPLLL